MRDRYSSGHAPRIAEVGAALAVAGSGELDGLAADLIELAGVDRTGAALRELARHWERLSAPARAAAMPVGRGQWGRVIETLESTQVPGWQAAAAALAADTGEPALVARLPALLTSGDAGTVSAALRALASLVDAPPPRTSGSDHDAATVDAVLLAADGFQRHRRREVWSLLLRSAAPIREGATHVGVGRLAAWIRGADPVSLGPFRAALRQEKGVLGRTWAWWGCAFEPVASACVDRLAGADHREEHHAVLDVAHLAEHPLRRRALLGMDRNRLRRPVVGPVPDADTVASMTPRAQRGLSRWLDALPLASAHRDAAMANLLAARDPLARLLAVQRAADRSLACVEDFAHDAAPRVARSASVVLLGPGPARDQRRPDARRVGILRRSPHEAVRRQASACPVAPVAWDPDVPASRLALRAAMADDRARFIDELRRRVLHAPEPERIASIRAARALGCCNDIELELLRAITGGSSEVRVVATALGAVACLPGSHVSASLLACMEHADARVRANAIEGAVRRARDGLLEGEYSARLDGALAAGARDAHPRVRAAAIAGIVARDGILGAGGDELARMLLDSRPAHRRAAVWIAGRVDRTRLGPARREVAQRLTQLSVGDPDDAVRASAQPVARLWLAERDATTMVPDRGGAA